MFTKVLSAFFVASAVAQPLKHSQKEAMGACTSDEHARYLKMSCNATVRQCSRGLKEGSDESVHARGVSSEIQSWCADWIFKQNKAFGACNTLGCDFEYPAPAAEDASEES